MKKNYITPQIETTFYEPILMENATNMTGTVYDGNGNVIGGIDDGGIGDEDDTPDAKSGNLWDGWDD